MQLTKIDDRGRILLPKGIRDELNLKPGEELFAMNAGKDTILLRKVNIKKMMGNIIEKIKEIDFEKLELEVEDEGNRIARKKYPKIFS
ncbi:MAG: AbrB family transcriptional regulator [Candidatus Methanoperedens sp.]|nr:AbrB family transcriptional regulator [Candidatus Methanoperedens sp.]